MNNRKRWRKRKRGENGGLISGAGWHLAWLAINGVSMAYEIM
jgi:hypothetical protein